MSRQPEVKWADREDKIYLTVLLVDAKNPKVNVEPDGTFTFTAAVGAVDNLYELKLELLDKVNVEECKINIGVRNIFCVLKKAEKKWWTKLLRGNDKTPHYVKVDWDKWVDEDDDTGAAPTDFELGGMDTQSGTTSGMGSMSGFGEDSRGDDFEDSDNEGFSTNPLPPSLPLCKSDLKVSDDDVSEPEEEKAMAVMYCFVARGKVILADYSDSELTGNFTVYAKEWVPAAVGKYTRCWKGLAFNYLVEKNGLTYCLVVGGGGGGRAAFAFLKEIEEDFAGMKQLAKKAHSAGAMTLNKKFRPTLKKRMQQFEGEEGVEIAEEGVEIMQMEITNVLVVTKRETPASEPQTLVKARALGALASVRSAVKKNLEEKSAVEVEIKEERTFVEAAEALNVHNAGQLLAVRRMTRFHGRVTILGHATARDVRAFKAARPDLEVQ